MKFVFASDSFKGTLSSADICALLETAATRAIPGCTCIKLLMADGGEDTLDAIADAHAAAAGVAGADAHAGAASAAAAGVAAAAGAAAAGADAQLQAGSRVEIEVLDALLRPIQAQIFVAGNSAFVEVAQTCGLTQLGTNEQNPLNTTSFGVGQSIIAALDAEAQQITVGLGGSSTNDGGMGCLRALGVRFLDSAGNELLGYGRDLAHVAHIDITGLDSRVHATEFSLMCDVRNPLLGSSGATYTFGPQKGAHSLELEMLESGMRQFASLIEQLFPRADFNTPGFGAAGGLGMALSVFCGSHIQPGIEAMLRLVNFDALAADADLIITGEGQMDAQSFEGKVPFGVLMHAKQLSVPCVAICGRVADRAVYDAGFAQVIEASAGQELAYALKHARENYERAAGVLFENLL